MIIRQKYKYRRFTYFLAIVVLSFLVGACAGSRKLVKKPIPQRAKVDLLDAIDRHNQEFDWFSASVKLKFESAEESGKVRINLRMKKDSIIYFNVKKLAVEVARVLVTPDSVFILYRIDQMFERDTYEEMMQFYGVNITFSELQQLIIGNCILPNHENATSSTDSISYFINSVTDTLDLEYALDPFSLKLENFNIEAPDDYLLKIIYRNYKKLNDSLEISHSREYFAASKEEEGTAKLDLSSIQINVKKRVRFEIPEHYSEYR